MAIDLRDYTPARVAIGRTGHSVPTRELLRFQLDHARARDAVLIDLDPASLGFEHILLRSAAPDRATYLRRPDLGRRLSTPSRTLLHPGEYDVCFVIADGLSSPAVSRHAKPLLETITPKLDGWKIAPLTVVLQGRVAIADEVGERLGARLAVIIIGERPGLSSPDSLGVYLTWDPRVGRHDADRNCISNVRQEGLSYELAAHKLHFLLTMARRRQLSGVALKEDLRLG